MKIGIIGSGSMGKTLGKLWAEGGHEVMFGSRDAERTAGWIKEEAITAQSGSYAEAAAFGEAVVLVTAWADTESAIRAAGSLADKVLIDATNPESSEGEFRHLIGFRTSGAEQIAEWATGARVVKAFNHIYGSMLETGSTFGEDRASIFICGDDIDAKTVTTRLAVDLRLDVVDAGQLKLARYIEPLSALWVNLAQVIPGGGESIGLKFLRREVEAS